MSQMPDDLCPRPDRQRSSPTEPLSTPIYLSSVHRCSDPDQVDGLLSGADTGYVYRRDGQPNADLLAEKLGLLHGAEHALICGSGMSALALAVLSHVESGDRVAVSNQLYGRSQRLLTSDLQRFRVTSEQFDPSELAQVEATLAPPPRLMVVESISNPLVRVADIAALAERCRRAGTLLVVDNTLAGPTVCRPLEWGADLVLESVTKSISGHSDVVLGLLCGRADAWQRVPETCVTWGLGPAAFDAWLASRGVATLALRMERACANAMVVAEFLNRQSAVSWVAYPGLASHADHLLAQRQFAGQFGSILAFEVPGGRAGASQFIRAAQDIPFCPSLGEVCTTLSHPESTSHRGLSPAQRESLGITGGVIRLSVGIESAASICSALAQALASL